MSVYEVKYGDTLSEIAKSRGMSTAELARINGIDNPDKIKPGQKLIFSLPENDTDDYNTAALDAPSDFLEHKVVRGDSLWKLARQYGCSEEALRAANNIQGDVIRRGQVLIIPTASQRAQASQAQATAAQASQVDASAAQTAASQRTQASAAQQSQLFTTRSANPETNNVKADIRKAEGEEPLAYFAPEGKLTIGFGHQLINKPQFIKDIEKMKLTAKQKNARLAEALLDPENVAQLRASLQRDLLQAAQRTGNTSVVTDVADNLTLSKAQMELLLDSDVQKARDNAIKNLGQQAYSRLSTAQKEVMIDLYFNIGEGFHHKAPTFMRLVREGKLEEAQAQLDFYKSNGTLLRGLMKRSMARMKKWNNGELTEAAQQSLFENYNKLCRQDGLRQVSTFDAAERRIVA